MALVDRNLERRSSKMREPTRAAAEAFVNYLFTPEAQAEFAVNGFRCRLQPSHQHEDTGNFIAQPAIIKIWAGPVWDYHSPLTVCHIAALSAPATALSQVQ